MEVKVRSVFISLVLVTLLTISWRVVKWVWLKPKQLERCLRKQGFKGNPYKVLFGDYKEIVSVITEARSKPLDVSDDDIVPSVLPFHRHCVQLHGKNYFVWIGPTPHITITDPKLIKEMLQNYLVFRKASTNPLGKLLMTGILAKEGEEWVKHRNLITPAFHLQMLKQMVPAMYSSCSEMIKKWEVLVSAKGSLCEVDVSPYISNLAGDVISRTSFGSNYEEGKDIFQLHKTQSELVMARLQKVYLPGSRFLPTEENKKMKAIYHKVGTILTSIITKRKKTAIGEDWGCDLLGILLKTNNNKVKEHGNKKTIALTTEEIIEECKLFYVAGQETTSSLLVWAMFLLSKHQKWQDLAREEVLAVFGDNEPDFDGLNQLKTLNMILNEVLRLYPPVAYTLRRVHKTTKLGEFLLPEGTEVFIPMIDIHQDPEFWGEDAKEFNPERFSEGIAKATKGQSIFIPFSGGPRICIGQNFAMVEVKIVLATILRSFTFQLSPSYVHAPSMVLSVQPQHSVPLILHKI